MKSGIKACQQEKINLVAANENPATFFFDYLLSNRKNNAYRNLKKVTRFASEFSKKKLTPVQPIVLYHLMIATNIRLSKLCFFHLFAKRCSYIFATQN
jgi:hypothetical protein